MNIHISDVNFNSQFIHKFNGHRYTHQLWAWEHGIKMFIVLGMQQLLNYGFMSELIVRHLSQFMSNLSSTLTVGWILVFHWENQWWDYSIITLKKEGEGNLGSKMHIYIFELTFAPFFVLCNVLHPACLCLCCCISLQLHHAFAWNSAFFIFICSYTGLCLEYYPLKKLTAPWILWSPFPHSYPTLLFIFPSFPLFWVQL